VTVRILAIVGPDRSGSTLLDTILGGIPGVFSGGEIRYLWERGLQQRRLCGCGVAVPDCPVWGQVITDAYPHGHDAGSTVAAMGVLRTRHALTPLVPRLGRRYDGELRRLADTVAPVYRSLQRVSGAELVVDSSKRPTWMYLLRMVPDFDVRVVHLVRDPRAVAHSRKRFKRQLDSAEDRGMTQHPPAMSALYWDIWNVAADALSRDGGAVHRLRYEDLVRAPESAVSELMRFAGLEGAVRPGLTDASVELSPSHTVSGNPGRFNTGTVPIRSDDAWKTDQSRTDRIVVGAITGPLLARYGYRWSVAETGRSYDPNEGNEDSE
jgi:hypothetical protein